MLIEMDKPTLYMETTVPSYLLGVPSRDLVANARQAITRMWWNRDQKSFAVCVSDGVLEEAARGDRRAARDRLEFLAGFTVLPVTPDVQRLTALYLQEHIVPAEKPGDAAHLAFASTYQIQFSVRGTLGILPTPLCSVG